MLKSLNKIDTHVVYVSSENLFELPTERYTVVVVYDNCCFYSDIPNYIVVLQTISYAHLKIL